MRWITGGPDLPPELLQALEDEQLVLFCGAGVSYPVGLPTFRGLVERVYGRRNQAMEGLESAEFANKNYDRVLGLLERRIGASFVRRAVIETLYLDPGAALPTHKALLTLATTRKGVCRLITTNFDRGFELVAGPGIAIESAPKLPVPKLGVWNSVVHLHGLITDKDPDGRTLILTGADFGTAYLTERWASRFVSELF
jgi:NAD-dependent SIR2 family protein deacetylase